MCLQHSCGLPIWGQLYSKISWPAVYIRTLVFVRPCDTQTEMCLVYVPLLNTLTYVILNLFFPFVYLFETFDSPVLLACPPFENTYRFSLEKPAISLKC